MVEAIVECDYTAKEPGELSIKKGDVIKDVVRKQIGWCEGSLNEKKGIFPDNYVKLLDVVLRDRADVQRIRKCRVIFSYKQNHEDELNLNVGDVIEVVGEEEKGWWKGFLNDKVGVFPSNFVEEIFEVEKNPSVEDLSFETECKTPSLPPKPAKILCEVKFAYKAQAPDELTLKEGEILTLIGKNSQDQGWWRGELNGKIGVFPDNFVSIIDEAAVKDDKTIVNPQTKYIASQRKSFEPKAEAEIRALPPAVPGKKPSLPLKKSPSGSGGLFPALKKKIADVVDGTTGSKSAKLHEQRSEKEENAFDQVERSCMLMDVRATRAKGPGRRPPSVVYKDGEQTVINGNSDYGSLEENLSSSNTSIEQESELKPKVREWEKHKAPWLEEMKLNQAKRTSTSPGPESRKLVADEPPKPTAELPIDMSKSLPALNLNKKTTTPVNEEKIKVPRTPPSVEKLPLSEKNPKTPPADSSAEKSWKTEEKLKNNDVVLRNKPAVSSRPQSIETKKVPVIINKSPSPSASPVSTFNNKNDVVSARQFSELAERVEKLEVMLETQNQMFKHALDDLKSKLQVETDMRMLAQVELEKLKQTVMQV